MEVVINYRRVGDNLTIYTEHLIGNDGARLSTAAAIPPERRAPLFERMKAQGLLTHYIGNHSTPD